MTLNPMTPKRFIPALALAALASLPLASLPLAARADLMKQGATYNRDILVTDTTGANVNSLASGAFTATQSQAGGAPATVTPTITFKASGHYNVAYTAAMTATLGSSALVITATGAVQTDVGDQIVAFDPNDASLLGLTGVGTLASQTALINLSSSFVTVPTTGTTTGVGEVLTQKQAQALYLSVASGNNVPSGPPVASGSLTVTYYLVGLPSVAANVVEVATVNYDASRNQTSRTVKIAQPFPSIL